MVGRDDDRIFLDDEEYAYSSRMGICFEKFGAFFLMKSCYINRIEIYADSVSDTGF